MKNLVFAFLVFVASNADGLQVYDDFSTPKWTAFNTPGVNVYEQQGKLKIDFLRTAQGTTISGGYISTCRLEGDFDVSAEWSAPVFPVGNGLRIGLVTSPDPLIFQPREPGSDVIGQGITERVENPDGSFYVSDFYPLVMNITNAVVTSDRAGKLRLKRNGSQLNGFFWDKAALQWVRTGQTLSYSTEPVYMRLVSFTNSALFGRVLVKTTFDNVKINSGNCVEPITTATSYGQFAAQIAYSGTTPVPYQAYNHRDVPELAVTFPNDWTAGTNVTANVQVTEQASAGNGEVVQQLIVTNLPDFPGKTITISAYGLEGGLIVGPWYAFWLSYSCGNTGCVVRYAGTNSPYVTRSTWSIQ